MDIQNKTGDFPSPEDFLLDVPLYTSHEITQYNYQGVFRIEFFEGTIDAFCLQCGRESVFYRETKFPLIGHGPNSRPAWNIDELLQNKDAFFPNLDEPNQYTLISLTDYVNRNRLIWIDFECTRDFSHGLIFMLKVINKGLLKIGQYPSLADLKREEIKKYRPILSEEKYREFKRSIGLISHGIGIGAFVYLRRIIEELIDNAYIQAKKQKSWDDVVYKRSRVTDRIKLLKGYLPDFLVKNHNTYSILSKGIHDLDEIECLEHFGLLKLAIELILDDELERKEREKKIKEVSNKLGDLKGKLSQ
jgi:hypothetical protein